MLMWGILWLLGARVIKFDEDFLDVAIHGCTTCALGVVPSQVNTCKSGSFPISSYFIVCLKGVVEVLSVLATCVLDTEVIYD